MTHLFLYLREKVCQLHKKSAVNQRTALPFLLISEPDNMNIRFPVVLADRRLEFVKFDGFGKRVVMRGNEFESAVADPILLSANRHAIVQSNSVIHRFQLTSDSIDSTDWKSILPFRRSRDSIAFPTPRAQSFVLISENLWNPHVTGLFPSSFHSCDWEWSINECTSQFFTYSLEAEKSLKKLPAVTRCNIQNIVDYVRFKDNHVFLLVTRENYESKSLNNRLGVRPSISRTPTPPLSDMRSQKSREPPQRKTLSRELLSERRGLAVEDWPIRQSSPSDDPAATGVTENVFVIAADRKVSIASSLPIILPKLTNRVRGSDTRTDRNRGGFRNSNFG
jgi:hypothetical protein